VLQPGGVKKLEELGLRECLDNIDSQKLNGYGVSSKADNFFNILKYREGEYGYGFHQWKLIKNIRNIITKDER
jgi:squalene monooxygenase